MVTITLDSIQFRLRQSHDFSWLKRYGTAFWCVDETGSGCICIGMEQAGKKYFCKIAGVDTLEADVTPEASIAILKDAAALYKQLRHPNLTKLIEAYAYDGLYIAVFEWAEGECLFDHWNFEKYQKDRSLKSPKEKFRALPAGKRLDVVNHLFSFLLHVHRKGYAAVDFYDGSIMYDFSTDQMTICDIDLFKKSPAVNDLGSQWPGTKRLKAPEEYEKGGIIDQQTGIFTLGALIFDFFGDFSPEEIQERYLLNRFVPCPYAHWQLNAESYRAAAKAVSLDKNERYKTLAAFFSDWESAHPLGQ